MAPSSRQSGSGRAWRTLKQRGAAGLGLSEERSCDRVFCHLFLEPLILFCVLLSDAGGPPPTPDPGPSPYLLLQADSCSCEGPQGQAQLTALIAEHVS